MCVCVRACVRVCIHMYTSIYVYKQPPVDKITRTHILVCCYSGPVPKRQPKMQVECVCEILQECMKKDIIFTFNQFITFKSYHLQSLFS
jgi:hypothetical protein